MGANSRKQHVPPRGRAAGLASPSAPDGDRRLTLSAWWWLVLGPGLTLVLLILSFAPFDAWPLAYVCLVPWLIVVGATPSARRVYIVSYLLGLAFFCISIYWLFLVTAIGSIVLFVIFAVHFPLIACPVRHMVRRRHWPLAFALPPIWVGSEAVRSMFLLEFPWNLLGHTQHNMLAMIQVSDLVGAYGVSFVLATVNGAIADFVLCRWGWPTSEGVPGGRTSPRLSIAVTAVAVAATLVYGVVQLSRGTMHDGPKIAILQGNYPNFVDPALTSRQPTPKERANHYFGLLDAAAQQDPDLFLLPETPWFMFLNEEYLSNYAPIRRGDMYSSHQCYNTFRERAAAYDATIVTGSMSLEPTPYDLLARERRYNSAFVFPPDGGAPRRYDKMHLVMIGEYVPFRYGTFRPIYLWINRIGPFYDEDFEYSLNWGDEFTTFQVTVDGRSYGFATPICYENVMPYISRRFVIGPDGRKRCDFLLNLSNDGWFQHSAELPQHLAASVFRAVENRVGVARAVNTGISCFVDPDGRVHHVVTDDFGRAVGPGVDGYHVAPVRVDDRVSIYSQWGDWFAIACAILWGLLYLDYLVVRSLMAGLRSEETS